ncbi:MAG TPA: CoB--CoM heterodisulfide reductase iron-sulfur subunit B family protein [Conexivisphaerales archaeon]|nr:CoB--CoM heterodisulfide reductase iron-sulfur subunit B family protein [Conexivisphaerales archaeon]
MKSLQFFPGCSLLGFNAAYYKSALALGKIIGYELDEIEDWNCCGATAYFSISEERTFLANARNLAIAEKKSNELTVACGACYAALSKTASYYTQSRKLSYLMDSALREVGMVYDGKVKVRHLLEVVFNEYTREELAAKVVRPLNGIKVAPYYGCMIFRPVPAAIPRDALEQFITMVGAQPVDFSAKDKCCGGMLVNNRPDVGLQLVKNLLSEAQMKGAQLIITTCPLCQINLELYQGAVNKKFGTDFKIPVIYFTQMLGYAMGVTAKELDLGTELISSLPVLRKAEVPKA